MSVEKITTHSVSISASDLRNNVPAIKNMIQEKLSKGCSTTAALDIGAAAIGLNDYRSFKCQTEKSHIQVQGNIGSEEQPLLITLDVGFYAQFDNQVLDDAHSVVENCKLSLLWTILKDGDKTGAVIQTGSEIKNDDNGLTAIIKLTGNTFSDITMALEQVQSKLSDEYLCGMDGNDTSSYDFDVNGRELIPSIDEAAPEFIIMDDEEIIVAFSDEEDKKEALKYLKNAGKKNAYISDWSGELVMLQKVDINAEGPIFAINTLTDKIQFILESEELESVLSHEEDTFQLYQKIKTRKHK